MIVGQMLQQTRRSFPALTPDTRRLVQQIVNDLPAIHNFVMYLNSWIIPVLAQLRDSWQKRLSQRYSSVLAFA
jgi:hypothetical protein